MGAAIPQLFTTPPACTHAHTCTRTFIVLYNALCPCVCPCVSISGSWKTAKFKPYNLKSLGADAGGGHLHLLMKMRAEYRKILLEMGSVFTHTTFACARPTVRCHAVWVDGLKRVCFRDAML